MKYKILAIGLCLLLLGLPGQARATEKVIGTACSSDANATDWDTIAQCVSSTFARVSTFFAGGLGINMGSTVPQSTVDISGNVTIGTTYAGVNAAPASGMLVQGVVGIGTTSPVSGASLDLGTKTDSILLPVGTTGQEPGSPKAGMVRYNSTTNVVEYYNGSAWIPFRQSGGPPGSGYIVGSTTTWNGCMYSPAATSVIHSSTTATMSFSKAHGLVVGNTFTTAGFLPTDYNGTWTVATVPNSTSITFNLLTTPATNGTTIGNVCFGSGGLATANALCLTELSSTYTTWFGYAQANAAGLLNSTHVKAFLCDGSTCQNPNANTVYYFSSNYDTSAGGATFTTDGSSLGPNDNTSWGRADHFTASNTYFTARGTTSATAWSNSSTANNCSAWTSTNSGSSLDTGSTFNIGAIRWHDLITRNCSSPGYLICMVNP